MGRRGDDTEPESGLTADERPIPDRPTPDRRAHFGSSTAAAGYDDTLLRGDGSREHPIASDFPEVSPEHYDVGDEFARGGLGRILEAWDLRLNRRVALKELLSNDLRAEGRFLREAMITARLEHPNIVAIHEAGRWPRGDRFYAMKLVQGRTLSERLEDADSDDARRELLPAVVDVCDAVAYAHSQGILHRDLKPSNVMLGPFGETVLIDWGLAKDLYDPSDVDPPVDVEREDSGGGFETSDGIVVGTPPYMPPEQAAAQPLDPRSDVYALGAILYHVLSGYRPYQNVRPQEILRAVVSHPPTPLEDLAPDMPRDLIAIVNKAMARDPDDRYPSAQEMATELRRLLTGQMVSAHDYSPFELLRRFVARQKAAVLTASLAMLVLVVFAGWSFDRIAKQRNAAEHNAEVALTRLDRFRLERARAQLDTDPTEALVQLLQIDDLVHVSPGAASVAAEAVDRGVSRHVLGGHTDVVNAVAVSPKGRKAASASRDRTVRLWDLETGRGTALTGHTDNITTLAFARDGRLASGSHDHTVRIWARDGTERQVLVGHEGPVKSIAFSEDGAWLVSTSEDRTVRVWDLGSGEGKVLGEQEVERNVSAAFSADGKRVLSGGHGDKAIVWDLEGGPRQDLEGHEGAIKAISCAPSASRVAVSDDAGTVYVHDVATGEVRRFEGHAGVVNVLGFSPDGRTLASAGLDRGIWLWDLESGRHRRLEGHEERISQLAFTADGARLVSAGWDRTIRVWDLASGTHRVLRGHRAVVSAIALSSDGRTLVSGAWDEQVRVWELGTTTPRVLEGHGIGVHGVDFSPNGGWLASGGHDDTVRLWDLSTQRARTLSGHEDHIYRVRYAPDGRFVASSSDDRTVRLWRVSDGAEQVLRGHTADVEETAFSADGRYLASAGEDDLVWLWEVDTARGRPLKGHTGHVTDVAFTPDGRRVVSSSKDGTVRVWSVAPGGPGLVLKGDTGAVRSVAVAPDGARILAASPEGGVRAYDARSGGFVKRYDIPRAQLVRYSPDGRFFAVASSGPDVWLCRVAYNLCDRLVGHGAVTLDLAFDPDSRALVTGARDDTVRIWDVETAESWVLRGHEAPIFDVAVSADGRWVASGSADTTVRVWPLTLPPTPAELPAWIRAHTTYTP